MDDRKIRENLAQLDPQWVDDMLLSEGEVQFYAGGTDFERIWTRLEEKTAPQTSRATRNVAGRRKAFIILVAILVLGLFGTVFAAQMGYLEQFFVTNLPAGLVIVAGDSVADDGIVMTLEEILPSANGGVVVLSFAREDGQPFADEVGLQELQLDIIGDTSSVRGYAAQYHFEEELRKFYIYYSISTRDTMSGRRLAIAANTLQRTEWFDFDLPAAGTGLAENYLVIEGREHLRELEEPYWRDFGDQEEFVEVKADPELEIVTAQLAAHFSAVDPVALYFDDFPNFDLLGLAVDEDHNLYVYGKEEYIADNHGQPHFAGVVDQRTGWLIRSQMTYGDGDGNFLEVVRGVQVEDLPYLDLTFSYDEITTVSNGSWQLEKEVEDLGLRLHLALELPLTVEDGERQAGLLVQEIIVTPVNISIKAETEEDTYEGLVGSYDEPLSPDLALVLADGTRINYSLPSWNGIDGKMLLDYSKEYDFGEPERSRYLTKAEMAEIRYIEIEGVLLPVGNEP